MDDHGDAATAVDGIRSEGQRLLRMVPGSLSEIAAAVGASAKQSVANWRDGVKFPGDDFRAKLAELYGIPAESWRQVPQRQPEAAPKPPRAPRPADDEASEVKSTMAQMDALIAFFETVKNDEDVISSERLKAAIAQGGALKTRASLEAQLSLMEHRIVLEHPMYARVRAAILRALKPHPAATRDVVEALKALEEEQD